MSTTFKVKKVTTLPNLPLTTVDFNTIFLLKNNTTGYLDIYVSSADGTSYQHSITKTEVQSLITSSIASSTNSVIVGTIAERDALSPTIVMMAYVLDATADTTVTTGAAQYIYNPSNTTWSKIAEFESQLGPNISWSSITGGPTSTPAAIDTAVANSHSHVNKTTLDTLGLNGVNHLTVNGNPVLPWLSEAAW